MDDGTLNYDELVFDTNPDQRPSIDNEVTTTSVRFKITQSKAIPLSDEHMRII